MNVTTAAERVYDVAGRRRGGLGDEVAAHIRDRILTGELRPGSRIDQDALCVELDVSRSPVREALVVLGQEGLVEVNPGRGASVADITPADIVDHYELFGVVAGRAAAMAADSLSDAELTELRRIHETFEQRGSGLGAAELGRLNDAFHRIINAHAPRRTRWLLRLLARSVPTRYYEFTGGWDASAAGHHREILAAIEARDPERARRAMEDHLHESGLAAVAALRRDRYWDDDSNAHDTGADQEHR